MNDRIAATIAATGPATDAVRAFITNAVRAFIVENCLLGQDPGFDNAESLLESGMVDSTGIMAIVAFLEERFGIDVEDAELVADNLDSVARIAAYVARKRTSDGACGPMAGQGLHTDHSQPVHSN